LGAREPDRILNVNGYSFKTETPLFWQSASEMTYIVSGGALNSTHSLCSGKPYFINQSINQITQVKVKAI